MGGVAELVGGEVEDRDETDENGLKAVTRAL